ncbi:LysR family transcriptional regulator [Seongchinamella sediminis]|uniref:LysR family transcriptional regulator n=1 Tax=Seongchinamella sediminis TaxID=2283635 RepID=A0A3L7DWB0_9GAMM|nr:LysR family transcriptional regulator [Seongchinamella sediminis]RLQ21604.1 LysR family transcriptional regulator [Seongchinamella sediminis]
MDTRELAKIDLNLLISLQVLLEEQNVSRAAERLFITQPAMSKTLSRLRSVFDDPLFTRAGHGMQATPRALELAGQLADILAGISQLVSRRDFAPADIDAEVTLALSEYIGVALLPRLAARLQAIAPKLHLRVVTRVENQREQLALGNLDFAIHIRQQYYGPEFRIADLGGSPVMLLLRENHPLCQGEISAAALSEYPLIRLYVSDRQQVEAQTGGQEFESLVSGARGWLEISHLMTAMEVLRNSDYFMPGPAFLLQNESISRGITARGLPGLAETSVDYVLVAHQRTENSPLHNWLWEQITCTIRELRPTQPRKLRQRVAAGAAAHR